MPANSVKYLSLRRVPSSKPLSVPSVSYKLKIVSTALFIFSALNTSIKVGSGARAEKIRTYNYKDNRVTDHRLKMNFELTSFLDGDIETAVQSCATMEQKELLEELAESAGAPAR